MIECREASQLRHHAAALALASDAPAVDAILGHVGSALGLPLFGYHLDAAHPSYTDETFRKLLQQGWPREALELRWQGKGSILLRLRAPGSLIIVDTQHTAKDRSATPQHRAVSAIHAKHGIQTILGVPVPRPGGRSANVYFGGARHSSELDRILSEIAPKLLAVGLLAIDALEGPVPQRASREKGTLELTSREWDCLHFLMEGYRDKEIAELTGTKMTTVRYHLENVVEKLQARNRTHAASIAAHLHWLEVPFKNEDGKPAA
jgi:DNA-binding CsgD family transcriptional regulator